MAVTAHSDPFAVFLRKVGYSVGLEFTSSRVKDLVSRYLEEQDLTVGTWHTLVTGAKEDGNWERKGKSAEKNLADFFHSLRLIHRTADDVLILENLDALAITSSLLSTSQNRAFARDFLLLWGILVNDGEIFVNLLLAEFQEERIKEKLTAMLLRKRAALLKLMTGKASERRINRVITIERQEKNRGSVGTSTSVTSLKRTEPLQTEYRSGRNLSESGKIEFSDDYFRKVPPRRREWAISLGLWDGEEDAITTRGRNFIKKLQNSDYIDRHGRFIFWPMDYELVRSGFRPDLFGEYQRDLWACLVDFADAYADISVKSDTKGELDETVASISAMMNIYRNLHVRKAMLRRELPIVVAYPAAVALACASREPLLNLPEAVATERKGEKRRVVLRASRNTGGTLSVKEKYASIVAPPIHS